MEQSTHKIKSLNENKYASRDFNDFGIRDTININPNLFTASRINLYQKEINKWIDDGLIFFNEFERANLTMIGNSNDKYLLDKIKKDFPLFFKEQYTNVNENVNDFIVKNILNKLVIYENKLANNNKMKFKLKIFLNKVKDKYEIDYNNIYLIVSYDDINSSIIYFKLESLKLNNNKISKRTKNIISKYLFKQTAIFIKECIKEFYCSPPVAKQESTLPFGWLRSSQRSKGWIANYYLHMKKKIL